MNIIKAENFKLKIFNNKLFYLFYGKYEDREFIYRINWEYCYGETRRRFVLCNTKNFNWICHKGYGIKDLIRNMYYNINSIGKRYPYQYYKSKTYPVENFKIYEFIMEEEFKEEIDKIRMVEQLSK